MPCKKKESIAYLDRFCLDVILILFFLHFSNHSLQNYTLNEKDLINHLNRNSQYLNREEWNNWHLRKSHQFNIEDMTYLPKPGQT